MEEVILDFAGWWSDLSIHQRGHLAASLDFLYERRGSKVNQVKGRDVKWRAIFHWLRVIDHWAEALAFFTLSN